VGTDVYFVKLLSSVWAASNEGGVGPKVEFSKIRVRTETFKAKLRADLADRVEALYGRAISQAHRSEGSGLDGVTYRFSIARLGCVEVWSPASDNPDSRLVTLAEMLEKHARIKLSSELIESEQAIERATRNKSGA
jgi:hypothetical protein